MKKIISSDHDVIRVPVSLLSDENFGKLTSRSIDLLFTLADKRQFGKSVQALADSLGMRVVNVYRERAKLKELGLIQLENGRVRVSFPLDFEITGFLYLPSFIAHERLSTEEWRLVLALYRIAHEKKCARFDMRTADLCAVSGVSEKNIARVRRELIGKGLLWRLKKEYLLMDPVTLDGIDKVFQLEP